MRTAVSEQKQQRTCKALKALSKSKKDHAEDEENSQKHTFQQQQDTMKTERSKLFYKGGSKSKPHHKDKSKARNGTNLEAKEASRRKMEVQKRKLPRKPPSEAATQEKQKYG